MVVIRRRRYHLFSARTWVKRRWQPHRAITYAAAVPQGKTERLPTAAYQWFDTPHHKVNFAAVFSAGLSA